MTQIDEQTRDFAVAIKTKLALINHELERFVLALGLAVNEPALWDVIDGVEDLPKSLPSHMPLHSSVFALLRLRNDISASLDKFEQQFYDPYDVLQNNKDH